MKKIIAILVTLIMTSLLVPTEIGEAHDPQLTIWSAPEQIIEQTADWNVEYQTDSVLLYDMSMLDTSAVNISFRDDDRLLNKRMLISMNQFFNDERLEGQLPIFMGYSINLADGGNESFKVVFNYIDAITTGWEIWNINDNELLSSGSFAHPTSFITPIWDINILGTEPALIMGFNIESSDTTGYINTSPTLRIPISSNNFDDVTFSTNRSQPDRAFEIQEAVLDTRPHFHFYEIGYELEIGEIGTTTEFTFEVHRPFTSDSKPADDIDYVVVQLLLDADVLVHQDDLIDFEVYVTETGGGYYRYPVDTSYPTPITGLMYEYEPDATNPGIELVSYDETKADSDAYYRYRVNYDPTPDYPMVSATTPFISMEHVGNYSFSGTEPVEMTLNITNDNYQFDVAIIRAYFVFKLFENEGERGLLREAVFSEDESGNFTTPPIESDVADDGADIEEVIIIPTTYVTLPIIATVVVIIIVVVITSREKKPRGDEE